MFNLLVLSRECKIEPRDSQKGTHNGWCIGVIPHSLLGVKDGRLAGLLSLSFARKKPTNAAYAALRRLPRVGAVVSFALVAMETRKTAIVEGAQFVQIRLASRFLLVARSIMAP